MRRQRGGNLTLLEPQVQKMTIGHNRMTTLRINRHTVVAAAAAGSAGRLKSLLKAVSVANPARMNANVNVLGPREVLFADYYSSSCRRTIQLY